MMAFVNFDGLCPMYYGKKKLMPCSKHFQTTSIDIDQNQTVTVIEMGNLAYLSVQGILSVQLLVCFDIHRLLSIKAVSTFFCRFIEFGEDPEKDSVSS
jgi:hypothetical protein